MKAKKKTAFTLATIMSIATILAACGSGTNEANKPAATGSPSASTSSATPTPAAGKYDKQVSLKWFGSNQQGVLAKDGSVLQKKVESMFNVKIQNVPVDWYNGDQTNVFLASGDNADYMYLQGDASKIINSGAVRPISIDMLQKYAPAILKALDDLVGRDLWTQHLTVDGKLYGIGTASKTYLSPNTLAIRKDWMEAVGGKVPTTLKELEDLLLKFRTDDPDKNGKKDTYGLSKWATGASVHTNIMPYIFGAYGIAQDYWMDVSGKLVYSPVMPQYKDVLKTFQDWYKKEIFDPEVVLDDRAKLLAKMDANKISGYVDIDAWLDATNPSGPAGKLKTKGIDMVLIPPVKGSTGLVGTQTGTALQKGLNTFFGKKTTDEQVIRILQMQNDIFSDPKLYATITYGNEGEAWSIDSTGNYVAKPEASTVEAKTDIGSGRFYIGNLINDTVFPVRVNAGRRVIVDQIKNFPVTKIAPLQPDLPADKSAAMYKIETEFFWKAFSGQLDIDKEWDKYVASYMDAGGKLAEDNANTLYKTFLKK